MGIVFSLKDEFSRNSQRIRQEFGKLEGVTSRAVSSIQRGTNQLKMGLAGIGIGATLVAPLGAAVGVSMEFSKAMSNVGAITNASAEDLAKLREQAKGLGASTAFSASQASEAMAFLGMAGFSTTEIMEAMPGTLALAAAGNIDLATAADIASNVLSGMGLPVSETNRVMDVLAKTASSSNTSIRSLGESFKEIAPTAATLGVSLEETAAMIGVLGNNGFQGTKATSTLQTALLRFAKPTKAMNDEMQRLGINMFDSTGKFKGLAAMVTEVEKATAGMTDQQRLATVSTLFGAQASGQFLSMMNAGKKVMIDGKEVTLQGAEAMKAYTEELNNAEGAAQKMADTQLDNLAGDITKFKSASEGLAIALGETLEPVLRKVVQAVSFFTSALTDLMGTKAGKTIVLITASVGALLVVVGGAVAVFAAVRIASGQLALSYQAMGQSAIAAKFANEGLVSGLKAVARQAVQTLIPLLPYIAVGIAIAGAVVLMYMAYQKFTAVLNGGEVATSGFLRMMQQIGGVLWSVGQIITSWDGKTFNLGGKEAELEALGILGVVQNLATWVVRAVEFVKGMGDGFTEVFNTISSIFGGVVKTIETEVNKLLKAFGQPTISLSKLTVSLDKVFKAGKIYAFYLTGILSPALIALAVPFGIVIGTLMGISMAIRGVIALFTDFEGTMATVGQFFTETFLWMQQKAFEFLTWAVSNIPVWVVQAITMAVDGAMFVFMTLPIFLVQQLWNALVWMATVMPVKVYDFFTKAGEGGKTAWSSFLDWIGNTFSQLWDNFSSMGEGIVSALMEGLAKAWGELEGWLGNKLNNIPGADMLGLEFGGGSDGGGTSIGGGGGIFGDLSNILPSVNNMTAEANTALATSPAPIVNNENNNVMNQSFKLEIDGEDVAIAVKRANEVDEARR